MAWNFKNMNGRTVAAEYNTLAWSLVCDPQVKLSDDQLRFIAALAHRAVELAETEDERAVYLRTRGTIFVRKRELDRAAADFRDCLAMLGPQEREVAAETLWQLVQCHLSSGRRDAAVRPMTRLVRLRPDVAEFHLLLAGLLEEGGAKPDAFVHYSAAADLFQFSKPEEPEPVRQPGLRS